MFKNKESLVLYFISGYIHLSRKDYGFFSNINQIIKTSNQITSNQNKLCSKLIVKYQRQLVKCGYNIQELEKLHWNCDVVETKSEYTEAHVYLEDHKLIVRSPFNTLFLTHIRKLPYNPFVWDKIKKCYVGNFNTVSFKIAVDLTLKYFPKVNFDSRTSQLLKEINCYNDLHWEPTLRCKNNFYYISGLNPSLYESIKDIPLNSSATTLYELSKHGIKVCNSIVLDDPLLKFASSSSYAIDLDELKLLAEFLTVLKEDTVFASKDVLYNKQINNEIKKVLSDNGITVQHLQNVDTVQGILLKTSTSRSIFYNDTNGHKFTKQIQLTNSRPVFVR